MSATTLRERDQVSALSVYPAWIRFPRVGEACPITGMRRGTLYALAAQGRIKTSIVSVHGKTGRGARFISVASILKLIEDSATPEREESQDTSGEIGAAPTAQS